MARHHNADWVATICSTNGASLIGVAQNRGLFAVAHCFAIRDRPQHLPHAVLKFSAHRIERHIKFMSGAGEVFIELANR